MMIITIIVIMIILNGLILKETREKARPVKENHAAKIKVKKNRKNSWKLM